MGQRAGAGQPAPPWYGPAGPAMHNRFAQPTQGGDTWQPPHCWRAGYNSRKQERVAYLSHGSAEGTHADRAAQRAAAAATAAAAADTRHCAVLVGSAMRGGQCCAGLAWTRPQCGHLLCSCLLLLRCLLRYLLRCLLRCLLRLLRQVWVVQAEIEGLQQAAQAADGISHHHVIVTLGANQQLHHSQHTLADCSRRKGGRQVVSVMWIA